MSEALTPRQAYALMREAVDKKGEDYTYTPITLTNEDGDSREECQYVDWTDRENPVPSCIVGHVILGADIEPSRLRPHEGVIAHEVVRDLLDVDEDGPLAHALDLAQRAQDEGETWGEALRRFEEELALSGVRYRDE